MLQIPEVQGNGELVVETKDVSLNFDSRVARGLVVTVRALDGDGKKAGGISTVSVSINEDSPQSVTDLLLISVAKSEINALERKRAIFPDSKILLNQLASLYSYIGDHDAAISILRESKYDADDLLKYRLAILYTESNDHRKADQLFANTSGKWRLPSLLGRAYISVRGGDVATAKGYVSEALQEDFFDYTTQLMAGAIHLWDKTFRDAVRCFKVASEERPKSAIPLVHMAAAYFALNQPIKAINALRKAVFLNPLDDKAVTFYSDLLARIGKPELGLTPLKQLYELWGDSTRDAVLDRLAKTYLDVKEPSKALQVLQRRVSRNPENPFLLNNAGIVQLKSGRHAEGKTLFKEAADLVISNASTLSKRTAFPVLNLLTLMLRRDEFSSAISYCRRLLDDKRLPSQDDFRYEVQARYLEALSGLGDVEGALKLGEKFLSEADASNPLIYKIHLFMLHEYSVVMPDREKALKLAREALEAWSREDLNEEIKLYCANNAIFTFLQYGEIREAAAHLKKVERYVAKNVYVTGTWGLYYLKKNDFRRAKTYYERAVEMADTSKLKSRLRQRMALEFAKQYAINQDVKEALYWSGRAAKEKEGLPYVKAESDRFHQILLKKIY